MDSFNICSRVTDKGLFPRSETFTEILTFRCAVVFGARGGNLNYPPKPSLLGARSFLARAVAEISLCVQREAQRGRAKRSTTRARKEKHDAGAQREAQRGRAKRSSTRARKKKLDAGAQREARRGRAAI